MKLSIFVISIFLALFYQEIFGLEKESEHFIYYFEAQDSSIIDSIASRLEESYKKITSDLELTINGKTGVHIYPSLQEFHNAIGWPDAPDWVVGVGWTELHVVSPLNPGPAHSYDEIIDNVFIHEFTHVCTGKVNGNLPIWLHEGFACYEGGPYYSKASVAAAYNILGRIPSLDELNSSFNNFANLGGYPFCLTISRFIVETYGMENMNKFIRTPSDYSIFSGLTKTGFQELWMEYVKVNYLGINSAPDYGSNDFPGFILHQNYPNPFNPLTSILFSIPRQTYIQLKVFDTAGKEVTALINEEKPEGSYSINFRADNFASGIYYYQLIAGEFIQTRKMILIK